MAAGSPTLGLSLCIHQQTRVYPYPLVAGSARPNPKMGAPEHRKPFISRVFCAQRGSETMVSDHGLGRGQTMGRGRSGDCRIQAGGWWG